MFSSQRVILAVALLATAPTPGLAQSGSFGTAVVVGADELIIAEPTTHFRPGTVYVYRRSGGEWQEAAQLRAAAPERADGFGTVLASTGNTLFVGQRAGPLHTFERDGTTWRATGTVAGTEDIGIQPAAEPDREWGEVRMIPLGCNQYGYCDTDFGIVLAAEDDGLLVGEPRGEPGGDRSGGHQAVVGARPEEGAGAVYAFRRGADGAWVRQALLRPSGGMSGDRFGAAIAIADGRALIGAPGHGAADSTMEAAGRVYEFRLEDGEWREVGVLESGGDRNADFGADIAIQGDAALIGAPGAGDGRGAAFLYRRDPVSGAWLEQSRLTPSNSDRGDRFGSAVALDGHDVWVGAPAPRGTETGTVYVYHGRAAEPPLLDAPRRIGLMETVTRDLFGDRIVAGGAGVVAVTATGMDHQAGAVYLYERDAAGEWQDGGTLVSAPDALAPLVGGERECTDGEIGPFDCEDVDLLAFVPTSMLRAPEHARGVRTNDNWGWTDPETGREYALVGRNDGTSFVDITDPTAPVLVGDLPKTPDTPPSQLWRDIKVYDDHAFIVADGAGNHGMQVFDLRRLRNVSDEPELFEPDAHYPRVASVHNIAINQETGFAYLVGSGGGGETCGGGLHMLDIREPLNPTFLGCFRDERGTHDVQCVVYRGPDERYRGREICLMSNADFFSIADVTDKSDPRLVARVSHPNPAYLHQGWVTEDHHYFFMDDESDVISGNVETTRTLVWDLTRLEDPALVTEFMGSMPASAHNLYVKDDFMYQANYRYGLHVLDITDPESPREVGYFDTSPYLNGPGFSAAWSNYPFFESGTVIVTSVQEGLFILKPKQPPTISGLPSTVHSSRRAAGAR